MRPPWRCVLNASLSARFAAALPSGSDYVTLRFVEERAEILTCRNGVVQPPSTSLDRGAMITVYEAGGLGYAATSDLSASGIRQAIERARSWARQGAGAMVFDSRELPRPSPKGSWSAPAIEPWATQPISARLDRVARAEAALRIDPRIVESSASVLAIDTHSLLLTSTGGEVEQRASHLSPELEVYAHQDGLTQRRTLGGLRGTSQQGGAEVLTRFGFDQGSQRIALEAIALLEAPECPTDILDVILAPDQMMLQIHESIGHPLELDRILGDERNYAGTSFVTPEMFGTYRYGSELLNISFDPTHPNEYASYGWDDDGAPAERVLLIERGILKRPLGGHISQHRSGLPGVANSRACAWNRPPIDRMANLNLEPGSHSLQELIRQVERGVFLETNASWSIDDSRNKFQFSCEFGREIVDGELGRVVRNPSYRGISATFWRSLAGVGDRDTLQTLGTPYCGKGEPNQAVRVGHASPACLFRQVDVFGGAA
ncbi:MAG: TldD/PmbA family protein [Deltaproteobacteria bacterium]|nr:MAG: TldD/PmbA family protein [Deltaproteobacteria bacterium]